MALKKSFEVHGMKLQAITARPPSKGMEQGFKLHTGHWPGPKKSHNKIASTAHWPVTLHGCLAKAKHGSTSNAHWPVFFLRREGNFYRAHFAAAAGKIAKGHGAELYPSLVTARLARQKQKQ